MITGVLIGRENLTPFLRGIPGNVEAALKTEVEALAIKLLRKVKAEKLSGQALKNRTGTLRASINYRIETTGRSIYGIVGTNKEYGAVHEYGFDGMVNVRDFLRMQVVAFGKRITPRKVNVRGHTRHMVIKERSFLRSSLREMRPEIRERLQAAIKRGAANAK
jgi:phage gpG-like protein